MNRRWFTVDGYGLILSVNETDMSKNSQNNGKTYRKSRYIYFGLQINFQLVFIRKLSILLCLLTFNVFNFLL